MAWVKKLNLDFLNAKIENASVRNETERAPNTQVSIKSKFPRLFFRHEFQVPQYIKFKATRIRKDWEKKKKIHLQMAEIELNWSKNRRNSIWICNL